MLNDILDRYLNLNVSNVINNSNVSQNVI